MAKRRFRMSLHPQPRYAAHIFATDTTAELALVCEIWGRKGGQASLKNLGRASVFWKTFSTFYSKNPPLGIEFKGKFSENGTEWSIVHSRKGRLDRSQSSLEVHRLKSRPQLWVWYHSIKMTIGDTWSQSSNFVMAAGMTHSDNIFHYYLINK